MTDPDRYVMHVLGTSRELFSVTVFLAFYDVDAAGGAGRVLFTSDRTKALIFDSAQAVLAAWKQQSTVQPLRADGKPNRPLSAYTISPQKL